MIYSSTVISQVFTRRLRVEPLISKELSRRIEMIYLHEVGRKLMATVLFIWLASSFVAAQTTAFTYQGLLSNGGTQANGSFDLQFMLFDLAQNGTQQDATVILTNVSVVNGIFTVQLDFGSNVFS